MNRFAPVLRSSALLLCFSLLIAGCNKERSPAAAGAQPGADTVVATYGGKTLTLGELDQKIADRLFELRRQSLEQVVVEDLVAMEAQKRGMTTEQFFKAEIEAKTPPPSEEDIQKAWEQVKPQLPPDATLDQFRERIIQYVSGPKHQERARQVFAELKQKANLEIKLAPPLPAKKEVEATGPAKGPENAKVTIVEFSDFQCPYCSRAADTVQQVMENYPGKVRLVFRHFPLDFHKQAPKAAEASLCANDQGKFWEYHDALFKNQDKLMPDDLKQHAQSIGLDAAKFDQCLSSGKYAEAVKKDMAAGQKAGVSGTPAFFINGMMISGAQPLEEFKRLIDAELSAQK
ncbi:MAG TPA: thioredoxin domain-containing protein [Myxococcaceae bacterium]|nr:thioredoxin domain-containing protein [Myxococcaceae bacterium]